MASASLENILPEEVQISSAEVERKPNMEPNDEAIKESPSRSAGEEEEKEPVYHGLGSGVDIQQEKRLTPPLQPCSEAMKSPSVEPAIVGITSIVSSNHSRGSNTDAQQQTTVEPPPSYSEEVNSSSGDPAAMGVVPTVGACLKGAIEDTLRSQIAFLTGLEELTRGSPAALEDLIRIIKDVAINSSSSRAEPDGILEQGDNLRELEKLLNMANIMQEMAVSFSLMLILVWSSYCFFIDVFW